MMNEHTVLIIDPKAKTTTGRKAAIDQALFREVMGEGREGVDFGSLTDTCGIIVYEFGLYEGASGQYFAIGSNLYSGSAIVFATNQEGDTVDLGALGRGLVETNIRWFDDVNEIERAIADGSVSRPKVTVNGEVFWRWPETVGGLQP